MISQNFSLIVAMFFNSFIVYVDMVKKGCTMEK